MACPLTFSALAGLIFLAWVRRKLPKVYHTLMLKMNCQRRLENPNSLPGFTIDIRLIQLGAPLESNMQRDMQWDVTCCTVTSASLLAILCLASGRSEDTRFTGMSMEQHRLLIQRNEGRFTLFLFQQHQRLGNSRAPCDDPHGRLTDTALRCVLYKEGTP